MSKLSKHRAYEEFSTQKCMAFFFSDVSWKQISKIKAIHKKYLMPQCRQLVSILNARHFNIPYLLKGHGKVLHFHYITIIFSDGNKCQDSDPLY